MNRAVGTIVGGVALLFGSACADLEVTNPNNPDIERALASPEDVINIANSTLRNWYLSSTAVEPYLALGVTADVYSANFGNFGMRFNNEEPRIPYSNTSASGDAGVAWTPRSNNYADLGLANDVLKAIATGTDLGGQAENDKYAALAMYTQGASLTNLSLLFDQAFVVDENTDLTQTPVLVPHTDVKAAALAKWDAVIALTAASDETYDATVLPIVNGDGEYPSATSGTNVELTSEVLNQMSNTMAARLLAYSPRTAADLAGVDWAKVLQYAEKGISKAGNRFDLAIMQDFDNWFSYLVYYGNEKSWVRVDHRVINMMDPATPAKFTEVVAKGTSADARYGSDYKYMPTTSGDPGRGIWMLSQWYHDRYGYGARLAGATRGRGPAPYILAAENDLLIAEALIRTNGDLARAASLINNTRVGRGELAPVAAGDGAAALLDALFYERTIELLSTNGVEFLDMRRTDNLQPGTMRHLPIPARELETLGLPLYTFGGVGKPDQNVGRLPNGLLIRLGLPARTSHFGDRPQM